MATYKMLGGLFTGLLHVDPGHPRVPRRDESEALEVGSDRALRIRKTTESAVSDFFQFGTGERVRLASGAAIALAVGLSVDLHKLIVSPHALIRAALFLVTVRIDLAILKQGPARPTSASNGRNRSTGTGMGAFDGLNPIAGTVQSIQSVRPCVIYCIDGNRLGLQGHLAAPRSRRFARLCFSSVRATASPTFPSRECPICRSAAARARKVR